VSNCAAERAAQEAPLSGTVNEVTKNDAPSATRRATHLVVALECDRPSAGSARFSLERAVQVTLGRGPARAGERREERGGLVLDVRVPAPAMSTAHARLVRAGGEWVIEDAGSTNGTFVNGSRVTRAVVGPGDQIMLGRTFFLVTPPTLAIAGSDGDLDTAAGLERPAHVTLDPEFAALLAEVDRIARSEISILVRGETGTGKEVLARSVHEKSGREGPFVGVNCGGIPATLVESHFFGHVKGAFSGALANEPGAFRAANGGTLFLDEVGDLPAAAQAALLRALQEREVVPVGSTRPIKVDLRVLAATHRPLEAMVARGEFRSDLLARLTGFIVSLPPLRARRIDVGTLVGALLRRLSPDAEAIRLTPAAAEVLFRYDWPHNTRELEQTLSRAIVLAGREPIDVSHLPTAITQSDASAGSTASGLRERDEKIRRELLDQLARHRGNLANVARAMGKARMQVHRWCQRFGIDPNVYRE
jgi:transcriptional regulator with AAA-type ATPase domain